MLARFVETLRGHKDESLVRSPLSASCFEVEYADWRSLANVKNAYDQIDARKVRYGD